MPDIDDHIGWFVGDKKQLPHEEELRLGRQRIAEEKQACEALYSTDAARIILAHIMQTVIKRRTAKISHIEKYYPAEQGYEYWHRKIVRAQRSFYKKSSLEEQKKLAEEITTLQIARVLFPSILKRIAQNNGCGKKKFTLAGKIHHKRIKEAKEHHQRYQQLINTLAEHNLRLIVYVAKKKRLGKHHAFYDLLSEGQKGLMHAARNYDPDTKKPPIRFSTYACWWIRQMINRELETKTTVVRRPPNSRAFMRRIEDVIKAYVTVYSFEPSAEEIAKIMNVSEETIKTSLATKACETSLDAELTDDGQTLLDCIEDTKEDIKTQSEYSEVLKRCIDKLNYREQEIVKLRIGLNGEPRTLEQCGKIFKVCRERIRQVEVIALGKLSQYFLNEPTLREYGTPLKKARLTMGHTRPAIPAYTNVENICIETIEKMIKNCSIETLAEQI